MGLKSKVPEIEYFLLKKYMITKPVIKKAQQGIAAAASCIPESLHRHDTPEGRVKNVNKRSNKLFHEKAKEMAVYNPVIRGVAKGRQS